jgi:hypothetical protein
VKLGIVLLEQHEYAQAEATVGPIVSGEKLATQPWFHYEAMSVLGGALAGLGRLKDAEPRLLGAYDGLVSLGARIPAPEKPMIGRTIDHLVALYRALGNEERAAFWASRQSTPR